MPSTRVIRPISAPLQGVIRPPGSKSLTNRALLLAAMARGTSQIDGLLDCDDSKVMLEGLRALGISLDVDWTGPMAIVEGCGGVLRNPKPLPIDVQNSGTTIRFLAAMLTACGGEFELFGVPRMQERPIGELIAALQNLGGGITAESQNEFPPVRINSQGLAGGSIVVQGARSSQFLSGLLMAAPLAKQSVEISIQGPLVSQPYLLMTLDMMAQFGVEVERLDDLRRFRIEPQQYLATRLLVEPDASAASYFFAAAAICGGTMRVLGLGQDSLQGDVGFVKLLQQMGCQVLYGDSFIEVSGPAQTGIECDMRDISDTVQTLAAVALFVSGPTTIHGIAHNRIKETDRIGNLAVELRKLGAKVEERTDGLTIYPPENLHGATLATHDDHRMAMSLSLVGLKVPNIEIENPECVSKTYPKFFADLESVCGY
jgi:3-phosphoshikimate 1-carboxyvinyltransferase